MRSLRGNSCKRAPTFSKDSFPYQGSQFYDPRLRWKKGTVICAVRIVAVSVSDNGRNRYPPPPLLSPRIFRRALCSLIFTIMHYAIAILWPPRFYYYPWQTIKPCRGLVCLDICIPRLAVNQTGRKSPEYVDPQ